MSESEPKPVERKVASYEDRVKKSYSNLGHEGLDTRHWGTAINTFSGDRFNLYTDRRAIEEEFVRPIIRWLSNRTTHNQLTLADLGGDDGFVLGEITQILKEKIPELKLNGFVVDIDPTGKAEKRFNDSKKNGHRNNLDYVRSDVTVLPFEDKSLDIIVSRMTMQYLDNRQQEAFFLEIDRVLKDDGLVEIMTVPDFTKDAKYNAILAEITFIVSGSRDFNRLFPTLGQFKEIGEKLIEAGSKLRPLSAHQTISMPLSAEGFADRFNLNEDQRNRLHELYKAESDKSPELFEEIDGTLCLKTIVLQRILCKVE